MLRFGAILLVAVTFQALAAAQEAATGEDRVTPSPPLAPERASARATMRTFLEAFYVENGPDLEAAAACLDLSGYPFGPGSVKANELAVQLKSIIDKTVYVEYEQIPDAGEGPDYVFLRRAEGEVVIARQANGEWLFSDRTVRSIEELYRLTATKQVVEGVEVQAPEVVSPAMWLRARMPETLTNRVLFLEGWQWIGLVAVILLGVLSGKVFTVFVQGSVLKLFQRRARSVDTQVLGKAIWPASALVMVLVWGIGIVVLGLPVAVLAIYQRSIWIVGVLAAVVTVYRLVDVVASMMEQRAQATKSRFDDLLVPLIRKSLKVFVVAVGIVLVAQQSGANVSSLVAGLGLGGLAFALAAQDTVSNLFGSFTVLLDRPFQVGDWIVTGDVEGTVEELGFRSTRVRTFYNSLITLPNSNLTNAAVDNLGQRAFRRWSTKIGVAYSTPPAKIDAFCEGVRELVRRHPYTRKDYYHVYLNEFGASALQVMLYVFFKAPDWATELRERHRLGVDILRLAQELGVEIAFPTQTLFLRQETWTPDPLDEDGYAEGSERLSQRARDSAQRLVEEALQGQIPSPVTIQAPPAGDDEAPEDH